MNITYFNLALCGYFLAGCAYLIVIIFKTQNFFRTATIIFTISFVSHTAYVFERWLIAKRPPFVGMYESVIFFSWAIALVYLVMQRLKKAASLAIPLSLSVVLILGFASLLDRSIRPLMPALKSNWLLIHATSYFIGYAGMAISFLASVGYLFPGSRLRKRDPGIVGNRREDLDSLSFRLVAFSFPFLTIGLTTGSVWAKVAWGAYWSWDPKETWALISWCVYAVYLHQRLLKNWQGEKAAFLNVIGFLCVLFTFFGVNYLLKGLHSYL